jgi:hypothetical protein
MEASGGSGPTPHTAEAALKRYEQVASIWGHDLIFTLNQLAKVNSDARNSLKGRFDLNRVGAIGHSMGGASVLQFAHDETRVQAVFDIDGSPIWNAANGPLGKPVLVLSAASTRVSYDAVLIGAKPGRHLRLSGSVHTFSNDFRLIPFLSANAPNPSPASTGSIDPVRALTITERYAEAFFDQYLKGRTMVLLNGPSPDYPEVVFQ